MTAGSECELSFGSWAELAQLLVVGDFTGWIFRGLPSYAYSPISSLERVLRAAGADPATWKIRENLSLGFFKARARLHLADTPADDDLLGWLSVMQHYGAPTRLADWTVSPLVGCYFAYERPLPEVDNAALWMLNARACRSVFGTKFPFGRDHTGTVPSVTQKDGKEERSYPGRETTIDDVVREENQLARDVIENEAAWPLPLSILRPDHRMSAQQACFVCSGSLGSDVSPVELLMRETPREEIVDRYKGVTVAGRWLETGNVIMRPRSDGREGIEAKWIFEIPSAIVRKIRLPYAWRYEALASLARMNITADSLFPGLDGVGRTTELYIQTGAPTSMRGYLGL